MQSDRREIITPCSRRLIEAFLRRADCLEGDLRIEIVLLKAFRVERDFGIAHKSRSLEPVASSCSLV